MTRRERLEARAGRRRQWAESREARAGAAFERVRAIADQIPFGQPILVGHHSEGRARRDQARIESGMRAAVDNGRMAERHAERAENIERHLRASVFSDDVDAVGQLRAKADRLEADRDRWKAENAEYRRVHKAELAALGPYDRGQSVPAVNSGYETKVLEAVERFLELSDEVGCMPDDWPRWRNALEDAWESIRRQLDEFGDDLYDAAGNASPVVRFQRAALRFQ